MDAPYEVIASADDDEAAWQAARAPLVTASDVPVILGIVPGKPKLWYQKVGLLEREPEENPEVPEMGHELEPVNAEQLYVTRTGRKVQRCQQLLRSTKYPWLGATLDYWTWLPGEPAPGPLELKVTGNKSNWSEDDGPAPKFIAQLQTQMLVADAAWGSLSAIIGSPYVHHRWLDFERDDAGLCDQILSETLAFHESVQACTNPPVDGDESTSEALRHLSLRVRRGAIVQLPADALDWDRELQAARDAVAAWKERQRYFENLLMTAIDDAEAGELPYRAGTYTFERQSRAAYSVAATTFRTLHRVEKKKRMRRRATPGLA